MGFFEEAEVSQVLEERLALSGPNRIGQVWIHRYFLLVEKGNGLLSVAAYLEPGEAPACEGLPKLFGPMGSQEVIATGCRGPVPCFGGGGP